MIEILDEGLGEIKLGSCAVLPKFKGSGLENLIFLGYVNSCG